MQDAGDQDPFFCPLPGLRHQELRFLIGDPEDVPAAFVRQFAADQFLFLVVPGLHGTAESGVRIVVRGRPVKKDRLGGVCHDLAVRQGKIGFPVRQRTEAGQLFRFGSRRHHLLNDDLFFRDHISCHRVFSGHQDHEAAACLLSERNLHDLLRQRACGRDQGAGGAVVPVKGQFIAAAFREGGGIEDLKASAGQVGDPDGTVDKADDLRACGGLPVGIEKTVHAEVAVMAPLTVVAAVGIGTVLMQHGMVCHLPYAAAHEAVIFVDLLPVGFGIAGAYAHGVGILAEEIGPVVEALLLPLLFPHVVDHLYGRIHLAAHVVADPSAVDGGFIVDRKIGVVLQVLVHGIGVAIASGFVAQAPHDDGGIAVDLVPLVKAGDAVQVVGLPLGIVADGVVGGRKLVGKGAVGLQIVLVHDVDAQLVGQLQKERIGRIVGGADGIDIELLAEPHVPFDLFRRHGIAACRRGIMMVHALELDLPSVDQEDVAPDLHGPEADPLLYAGGGGLEIDGVEDRLLCVPLGHIQVFKSDLRQLSHGGGSLCQLQVLPFQGEGNGSIGQSLCPQGQAVGLSVFACPGIQIREIRLFGDPQKHIPEDAVVAEHVLVLQVGPVAPAVDHGHQLVGAFLKAACQIELRRVVGSLGIADELSVDVQVQAGSHAHEGDHEVLRGILYVDKAAVNAHEVVLFPGILIAQGDALVASHPGKDLSDLFGSGNDRRMIGKLIADVGIERPVIAPELPAGRYVDLFKVHLIRIQHFRHPGRQGIEAEIPLAVQADDFFGSVPFFFQRYRIRPGPVRIRNEIGASRQLVYLEYLKAAIVVCIQLILHSPSFIKNGFH